MRRFAIVVTAIVTHPGGAHADPPRTACAYAAHSLTVFAETELAPLPTIAGRVDLEAGARWHHRWVAVEARAGGGTGFTTRGGGYMLGGRIGVSAGAALPLTPRLSVEPMLAYDLFVLWQPTSGSIAQVVHQVGVATPVTIQLYPHVAIEAFVELGLARYRGSSDLLIVAGPRLAVVL